MADIDLHTLSRITIDALNAGDRARAFDLACHAFRNPKAGALQHLLLGESMAGMRVQAFEPIARRAMLSFMESDRVDHSKMAMMWESILDLDPTLKPIAEAARAVDFKWEAAETALCDPFFMEGLRKLLVTNPLLERFLWKVRAALLLELYPKGVLKTKHLSFVSALAEQCFYNEFVYEVSAEEAQEVSSLPKDDPVAVAIRGCYETLHDINPKLSGVKGFRQMVAVHMTAPAREEVLRGEIVSFGVIDDEVSRNVQAMYEENPYPRWMSVDIHPIPRDEVAGAMLVAGCGTGRALTHMAAYMPNVEITAVDISRSSIAYAMREGEERGIENVSFYQGNIMQLPEMGKTFDFIECSGVLHHMKDPAAGWAKLIEVLNPGGRMRVALYSTKARADVRAVRERIAEKGYKPMPEDIRRLRRDIMDDDDKALKEIMTSRDFYAMSEMRDLVFHVQETTYTMPELKEIFETLGLELIRMKVPAFVEAQYRERFPADAAMTSFENWDGFEDEFPGTFAGMYKMICKRRGDDRNNDAAVSIAGAV